MPESPQVFEAGFDPTIYADISSVTPSQLLQMVQAGYFTTGIGGVIFQADAPDTATYPSLKSFIWGETAAGNPTGDFYWYDPVGDTWELLFVLDGEAILPNTINIVSLKLPTTSPAYKGIFVNGAGTAWAYMLAIDAIQNNTLPIARLVAGTDGQVLTTVGTTPTWGSLSASALTSPGVAAKPWVLTATVAGVIQWSYAVSPASLATGAPGSLLGTSGGTVQWLTPDNALSEGSVPVTKLEPGNVDGKVLTMALGSPSWEYPPTDSRFASVTFQPDVGVSTITTVSATNTDPIFTKVGHSLTEGQVIWSESATCIATYTPYYVHVIDPDTFNLATSLANLAAEDYVNALASESWTITHWTSQPLLGNPVNVDGVIRIQEAFYRVDFAVDAGDAYYQVSGICSLSATGEMFLCELEAPYAATAGLYSFRLAEQSEDDPARIRLIFFQ